MTVVNIIGGLGNQMFQYAFAYAISRENDTEVKLDISLFDGYDLRNYELELFNINIAEASQEDVSIIKYKKENIFERMLRKAKREKRELSNNYYKEKQFNFDKKVYNTGQDTYFEGYWQSEKYFKAYRNQFLKHFVLKKEIHPESLRYKQNILNTESVGLHIRRGDYVTNVHTNSVHGTCSLEYYRGAILEIEKKNISPHFFIFSDDHAWARENLNFIHKKTFVELEDIIPDHEEMYLMSLCKHNIIANSSFSWWGAWLNDHPDKIVIAPQKWFNDTTINTDDLIPKSWIRL